MNSSNPVFRNSALGRGGIASSQNDLENLYNSPSATNVQMRRLTMDDVVMRTGLLFAILVASAAVAWILNLSSGFMMIGLFVGLGLALYNSFARKVNPITVMAYAVAEGIFLGVTSHVYNTVYQGVVAQAILVTAVTFFSILVLYTSKKVRVTPKMYRVAMISLFTYFGIGIVSWIFSLTGFGHGYGFYGVRGLSLLLATFGVALAAFFILLDFDQAQKAIDAGAMENEAWRIGFGLMVTIIWLYLQVLQLLSSLRDR